MWELNVANKNLEGYLEKLPGSSHLSKVQLPGFREMVEEATAAKKKKADDKASRKGKGGGRGRGRAPHGKGRGSGRGRGKGNTAGHTGGVERPITLNPGEKRDITRKLLDRVLAKGEELDPVDFLYSMRTYDMAAPGAGQEPLHDITLVFASETAQYKCSAILSKLFGYARVTCANTGREPWNACDAGCCQREQAEDGPETCTDEPHSVYLIFSTPKVAEKLASPPPFRLLSELRGLDEIKACYGARSRGDGKLDLEELWNHHPSAVWGDHC